MPERPEPALTILRDTDKELEIDCRHCTTREYLDPLTAFLRFGEHTTFSRAREIARCVRCGSSGPDWVKVGVAIPRHIREMRIPGRRSKG